jgi:hypothetical protein
MIVGTASKNIQTLGNLRKVLSVSAWGFSIVIVSFLFLYIGLKLDEWLGTAPNFMFGLFFLALVTTIGRMYQDVWRKKE